MILDTTILIDLRQTLPIQLLEDLVFSPTVGDILVKYVDVMMSVLFSIREILNRPWHTARPPA